MLAIIFIIIGYLVGSINSAILVCKAMKLPDPRTTGSGNAGSTNVLRIGGKLPATLVLICDILKGFLPVLIAGLFGVNGIWLATVALAAVIGHMYPLYFKFRGGKGVATAFGGVLALSVAVAFFCLVIWVLIVAMSRYVSLASLVSALMAAIFLIFVHLHYFLPIAIIAALIVWRHMDNIARLRAGTENKIEF